MNRTVGTCSICVGQANVNDEGFMRIQERLSKGGILGRIT